MALRELTQAGTIPEIPVYLDSPMARSALGFYVRAVAEGEHEILDSIVGHPEVFDPGDLTITESVADSKEINHAKPPYIVISASGMATGGRVVHHLKRVLPDPNSSVILVGYQAHGTRGRRLLNGEDRVKIHGEYWPVKAEIASVPAFSVHADRSELLDWLSSAETRPEQVIAVHGDPDAMDAFGDVVRERLSYRILTPGYGESILL